MKKCSLIALLIGLAVALACRAAEKPNIILVMTDDQGWADVGYNSTNNPERSHVRTPTLDTMAANGLRFNRFYSQSPNCSPTRGSILTGRHPYRYGVWNPGVPIRQQERTIAQALGKAGYRTGHFGKWHLNGISGPGQPILANDPLGPGKFGFATWLSVSNFFETDWTFGSATGEVKTTGDGSDAIVGEAMKFIGSAVKEKTPFFAVVWYGSPHVPLKPLPEYQEKAGGSAYYGEIYGIDHSLGTLRAELRRLGIADNTVVWYCSDNGGVPSYSVGGLRGHKGELWEGGLRVPCIIEWPARIKKPFVTDVPAVSTDILPTLLEIAGVTTSDLREPRDGISLVPLMDGQMKERPKPIASWHVTKGQTKATKDHGHAALTDNRYKLHRVQADHYELYDLLDDPNETKDIAAAHPDIVASMKATLLAWQDSVLNSYAGHDYPEGLQPPPAIPADTRKKAKILK
jgi:arylsulfatase A-like enzyme